MKTKIKENKSINALKISVNRNPDYYFHADEDFREDREWGKTRIAVPKVLLKQKNQFEA